MYHNKSFQSILSAPKLGFCLLRRFNVLSSRRETEALHALQKVAERHISTQYKLLLTLGARPYYAQFNFNLWNFESKTLVVADFHLTISFANI